MKFLILFILLVSCKETIDTTCDEKIRSLSWYYNQDLKAGFYIYKDSKNPPEALFKTISISKPPMTQTDIMLNHCIATFVMVKAFDDFGNVSLASGVKCYGLPCPESVAPTTTDQTQRPSNKSPQNPRIE